MSPTELRLVCAGPQPDSERAAAILREEGVDARAVDAGAVDPVLPISVLAASLAPIVAEHESEWLFYIRPGEIVTRGLAREIARVTGGDARAYAYRARRKLFVATVPLLLEDPLGRDGEIRLLHRRRARFQRDGRLTLQGTVVRLTEPLHLEVGASGLTTAGSGKGAGVVLSRILRRPWLLLHPPTITFLVRNRSAISAWRDRVRRAARNP